jgi:hypothetical protein
MKFFSKDSSELFMGYGGKRAMTKQRLAWVCRHRHILHIWPELRVGSSKTLLNLKNINLLPIGLKHTQQPMKSASSKSVFLETNRNKKRNQTGKRISNFFNPESKIFAKKTSIFWFFRTSNLKLVKIW